jgi:hypothetical protein
MTRNVTLKLDATLLRRCKLAAVSEDKSLSQWLTDLMIQAVRQEPRYAQAKKRALQRLAAGWDLGGKPLTREELHDR